MGKRNMASRKSSAATHVSQKSNHSGDLNKSTKSIGTTKPKGHSKTNLSLKSDDDSSVGTSDKEGGPHSHLSGSHPGSGSGHSLNDLVEAVMREKPGAVGTSPVIGSTESLEAITRKEEMQQQVVQSLTLSLDVSNTPPALDSWRNNTSGKDDMSPVLTVYGGKSKVAQEMAGGGEGGGGGGGGEGAAGGGVVFPPSISAEALALAASISMKYNHSNKHSNSIDIVLSENVRKPSRKQSIAALLSSSVIAVSSNGLGVSSKGVGIPVNGSRVSSKGLRGSNESAKGLGPAPPSARGTGLGPTTTTTQPPHLDRRKSSMMRKQASASISTHRSSQNKRRDKQLMLAFYDVIKILLAFPLRTAVLIEDAQYCDELSWIELSRWPDMLANTTVLMTIQGRSSAGAAFGNKPDADLMIHVQGW